MRDKQNTDIEMLLDGVLTVAEAERFAGVKKTTLYSLMADGELPHTRIRGRRLIPKRALVELLAQELVGAET